MIFLFDDEDGQSIIKDCRSWKEAERLAEEYELTLIGHFQQWVDEDGNKIYLH